MRPFEHCSNSNKKSAELFDFAVRLQEIGAGEGTRTPTPKAPEPKSGASTNSATPATVQVKPTQRRDSKAIEGMRAENACRHRNFSVSIRKHPELLGKYVTTLKESWDILVSSFFGFL